MELGTGPENPVEFALFHGMAGHYLVSCDRKIGPYPCCSVVQGDCLDSMGRPKRRNTVPMREELLCRGCGATWKHDGKTIQTQCPYCGRAKDARIRKPPEPRLQRMAGLKEWASNKEKLGAKRKYDRTLLKKRVFFKVSGSIHPACVRCGCDDMRLLEVNHRNGGGRKELGALTAKFQWDIAKGRRKTDDLELLCRPCNALHYLEMRFGPLPMRVVWGCK